jgi:acyl dehydratase
MTTGRYISDLEAADSLGSFAYRVTPFIVREFCHAADLHQEIFHGGRDGAQAWPMPLVFVDKLRLFKMACPGGDGPVARVLAECRAEWTAPIKVGDRLHVEGRVLSRSERRGREYIEIEVVLRGADDGKLRLRFTDSAVFLSVSKPTGTNDGKKTSARPPTPEPCGKVFHSAPRRMTPERIRWYCDAQETGVENDGRVHVAPPNIHNDEAFAKSQGLPKIIGFGMSSMSWMFGYLLDHYGEGYLNSGALTAKFIRPVFADQLITTSWREKGERAVNGSSALDLDLWCNDDTGQTLTAGTATIFR